MGRLDVVSWRVDYTLSSSELQEVNEPTVKLCLQTQGAETGHTETTIVSVSADKFRVLLTGEPVMYHKYCYKKSTQILRASLISMSLYASPPELKQAQAMMNALQWSKTLKVSIKDAVTGSEESQARVQDIDRISYRMSGPWSFECILYIVFIL